MNKINFDYDPEYVELKGKIKSCTTKEISGDNKEKFVEQSVFNEAGKLIQSSFVNLLGETVKDEFQYDPQGNQTERKLYDSQKNLKYGWNRQYGNKGNLVELNKYNKTNALVEKSNYYYDAKGNMIEEDESVVRSGTLRVVKKRTYEYDGMNNCVREETTSDHNYDLSMSLTFASALSGRRLDTSAIEDQQFIKTAKNSNKYNNKGNIVERIEETFDKGDWIKRETTFEYDDKDRLVSSRMQYQGQPISTTTYKYDDLGNPIEVRIEYYDSRGSMKSYNYDGSGNWIKQTKQEWKKDTEPKVTNRVREIEYS